MAFWTHVKLALVNPTLCAGATRENLERVRALLEPHRESLGTNDLALLPEHFHFGSWQEYLADSADLARWLGCHLVAGSQHRKSPDGTRNAGVIVAPNGSILHIYNKRRPYANERQRVVPGPSSVGVELGGHRLLVMICADFWFTDLLLEQPHAPSLVLVPALSVTRKPSPDYSQALWRHTAVARAYEYGLFVGISDWAANSSLPDARASGVSGFADPTRTVPTELFQSVSRATVVDLDFAALEAFRADRRARGFFWDGAAGPIR